jgi:hypothetical protein
MKTPLPAVHDAELGCADWASAAVGLGCALVVSALLLAGRSAQPVGRSVLRSHDRLAGPRLAERPAVLAAAA